MIGARRRGGDSRWLPARECQQPGRPSAGGTPPAESEGRPRNTSGITRERWGGTLGHPIVLLPRGPVLSRGKTGSGHRSVDLQTLQTDLPGPQGINSGAQPCLACDACRSSAADLISRARPCPFPLAQARHDLGNDYSALAGDGHRFLGLEHKTRKLILFFRRHSCVRLWPRSEDERGQERRISTKCPPQRLQTVDLPSNAGLFT